MLWDLSDLAAIGDLARERGISSSAATNWRRYPDFPAPLVVLSTGPVYSRAQVRAWQETRWPDGHPSWGKVKRTRPDRPPLGGGHGDIRDHLRRRIRAGEWPPGAPLPSRIELGKQYGVGERTMARPIADLCTEGLLYTVPASGTYVTEPTKE